VTSFIESGAGVPDHSEENSPESRLLGHKITEVPDLVRFASPRPGDARDF